MRMVDKDGRRSRRILQMDRQLAVVLYVAVMIAAIVGIDIAFFRNQFWARLMVNIGLVLVFAAFYLRFLRGGG